VRRRRKVMKLHRTKCNRVTKARVRARRYEGDRASFEFRVRTGSRTSRGSYESEVIDASEEEAEDEVREWEGRRSSEGQKMERNRANRAGFLRERVSGGAGIASEYGRDELDSKGTTWTYLRWGGK
jgi:hypothetical protein